MSPEFTFCRAEIKREWGRLGQVNPNHMYSRLSAERIQPAPSDGLKETDAAETEYQCTDPPDRAADNDTKVSKLTVTPLPLQGDGRRPIQL